MELGFGAIDTPADPKIDPSIRFLAVKMDCAKTEPIRSVERRPLDDHRFNPASFHVQCNIFRHHASSTNAYECSMFWLAGQEPTLVRSVLFCGRLVLLPTIGQRLAASFG